MAGIYDTTGSHDNPLTGKPYENLYANEQIEINGKKEPATYANMAMKWSGLPVYAHRDAIVESIKKNQVTLVTAGTGVGKTVIIPKLALHAFDYKERVITAIPKRVITKATAVRDAKWLDTRVGDKVGYYFKGAHVMTPETKLIFTTTGSILSRMTGKDTLLADYKVIIIDEAHERSVQTDQVLLLLKYALRERSDIRVIIMSATIDVGIFRDFFNEASFKHIDIPGISYPITHFWDKRVSNWYETAVDLTMRILRTSATGDILIFGRSGGDAAQVCSALQKKIDRHNAQNTDFQIRPYCVKLASNSTAEEERYATEQYAYLELKVDGLNYTRKVVVSTNVAESSLTVNGILYVIDSGLEYTDAFDPETMTRSLIESPAPRSSLIQRAGRAGRVAPGFCFHLYSEEDYKARPAYPVPNIQKTDLTGDILDLFRLPTIKSEADLIRLLSSFISPPQGLMVDLPLSILKRIGAITETGITPHGHNVAKFRGIKPMLAHSILLSGHMNCKRSVIRLVAALTVLDGQMDLLFVEPRDKKDMPKFRRVISTLTHKSGEFLTLLTIMNKYMDKREEFKEVLRKDSAIDELLEGAEDEEVVEGQTGGGGSLDRWCRDNYLSAKRLRMMAQLEHELNRIYHQCTVGSKILLDPNTTPKVPSLSHPTVYVSSRLGGQEEVEIKQAPHIQQMGETNRVLAAFVLGCPFNIGVKDSKSGGFTNVSLNRPMPAKPADFKPKTPHVLFYEQFLSQAHAKFAKLNIVNDIPREVADLVPGLAKKHVSSRRSVSHKLRGHHRQVGRKPATMRKGKGHNPATRRRRKQQKPRTAKSQIIVHRQVR